MDFNFIPYNLNEDISDFYINDIEFIDTENGVDLYKAREGLEVDILGLKLRIINFYFYRRKLITIYFHLAECKENITDSVLVFEKVIGRAAEIIELDSGLSFLWKNETEVFGLVKDEKDRRVYLYNSTIKHSIFK